MLCSICSGVNSAHCLHVKVICIAYYLVIWWLWKSVSNSTRQSWDLLEFEIFRNKQAWRAVCDPPLPSKVNWGLPPGIIHLCMWCVAHVHQKGNCRTAVFHLNCTLLVSIFWSTKFYVGLVCRCFIDLYMCHESKEFLQIQVNLCRNQDGQVETTFLHHVYSTTAMVTRYVDSLVALD